MKKYLFILLTLISPSVFAGQQLYTVMDSNASEAEKILINLFSLTYFVGIIIGSVMAYWTFNKLTAYAANPDSVRNSVPSILIVAIGSAILFSLGSSISIATNTVTAENGYCFNYHDKVATTTTMSTFKEGGAECFDASTSEVTKELKEKLEANGKIESLEKFNDRFTLLLTTFQVVGLIFFIKALSMLVDISDGKSNFGYPSVLIILFMSVLAIDIDGTLEIILNTAKELASI